MEWSEYLNALIVTFFKKALNRNAKSPYGLFAFPIDSTYASDLNSDDLIIAQNRENRLRCKPLFLLRPTRKFT